MPRTRPSVALRPTTPWALRLFDRVPLPAGGVGIGIGVGVYALFLVYTALFSSRFGRLEGVMGMEASWAWMAELIQDLFLGLTLAIPAASIRGARRDLDTLQPHLARRPHTADDDRGIFDVRLLPVHAAGIAMGLVSIIPTAFDPGVWQGGHHPGWGHPSVLWLVSRNFLNWWAVGYAMALELMLGHAFSRLGEDLAPAGDLLDRSALAPFSHRALRNVSLWMLLAAFLSLTYLGDDWAGKGLILGLATLAVFAITAFVLPLQGARRHIAGRKREQLARVREAILAARDDALAPDRETLPGGRLADLLAYEARLQQVPEWPIDASTILRLALYLAIGFGSWLGAAIVERALDVLLR